MRCGVSGYLLYEMHIHMKLPFYKLMYGFDPCVNHTYIHTKRDHTSLLA